MDASQQENGKPESEIINLNERGAFGEILKALFSEHDGKIDRDRLTLQDEIIIDFSSNDESEDEDDNIGLTLRTLDKRCFENFENVKRIVIRGTNLKTIETGTFEGLTQLEELHIDKCKIESLGVDTFKNLPALKELAINRTNINMPEPELFSSLHNLEELYLQNNNISHLNEASFLNIGNLRILDLSHNPLEGSITADTFKALTNLTTLRLNNTLLTGFQPGTFSSLTKLKELYLNNCKLKLRLTSDMLIGLSALERLKLASNHIESLSSDCFESLINLQYLDLSNNAIAQVEREDFRCLVNLRDLNLRNNQIDSVFAISESAFEHLMKLKTLDLLGNKAEKFDRERLGLKEGVTVSWDEPVGQPSFYDNQIEAALKDQNDSIIMTIPMDFLYKAIGTNKLSLISYIKHVPLILFTIMILAIIPGTYSFGHFVSLFVLYNVVSCLIFTASYRSHFFKYLKLKLIEEYAGVNREFLETFVASRAIKYGLQKNPDIAFVTDPKLTDPVCNILGLGKNNVVLYVSEPLFQKLNRAEIEDVIDKKISEATTSALPINTIFRGALTPFPFLLR